MGEETKAEEDKVWQHQSDDLFIIFINNLHYEGATWIDMPATIIIVLKNTKRAFPTSLYLLSDFISQQIKNSKARKECCFFDLTVFRSWNADERTFLKTFIRVRFFVDKQLINLKL